MVSGAHPQPPTRLASVVRSEGFGRDYNCMIIDTERSFNTVATTEIRIFAVPSRHSLCVFRQYPLSHLRINALLLINCIFIKFFPILHWSVVNSGTTSGNRFGESASGCLRVVSLLSSCERRRGASTSTLSVARESPSWCATEYVISKIN